MSTPPTSPPTAPQAPPGIPEHCPPSLRSSLSESSFVGAMAHFYRGEMQRLTIWRSRLDQTTHWSILLTTGMVTFALGAVSVPHFIILLGLCLNTIGMVIEGRRYQHLHHSKWRINLMEHNFFATLLNEGHCLPEPTWRSQLARDLEKPHFTISLLLAVRLRLRRNYLMLLLFITAVWLTKVFIHPVSATSVEAFYQRLSVGNLVPSWLVAGSAIGFVVGASVLAALTPSEESLERWTRLHRSQNVRTEVSLPGVPLPAGRDGEGV